MVAELLKKGNEYRCSACRMVQPSSCLGSFCIFCGAPFTNWETLIQDFVFKDDEIVDTWADLPDPAGVVNAEEIYKIIEKLKEVKEINKNEIDLRGRSRE